MLVQEVMNPNPIFANINTTLRDAQDTMLRHDIHELPLVYGDDFFLGVATLRCVQVALASVSPVPAVTVTEPTLGSYRREVIVETPDAKTLAPTESMTNACRMLVSLRVGSLPVVDGHGRLCGVLSVTDVVTAAADLFEGR